MQALYFDLGSCDDQFAAPLERQAMIGAEALRGFHTLAAEPCLHAAGLVINAGMHDAAVASRLVCGGCGLLVQQEDRGAGLPGDQLQAGSGADNAGADDDVVVFQLRLQIEDAFSIGIASTQPS